MEPVGNHGLSCLGEEDYAATALYMQSQGLAIDSALDAISDSFDSSYLRPGVLASSNANQAFASGVTGNLGAMTVIYNNFPVLGGVGFITPRAGWWQYGSNVNMVATGAVTANSLRRFTVRADMTTGGPPQTLSTTADQSFETNTAGEWLACSAGTFYAPANRTITIRTETLHANAASTVNNMAGARTWCYFIGSGVEIGSA
jgi:hypothetical protein